MSCTAHLPDNRTRNGMTGVTNIGTTKVIRMGAEMSPDGLQVVLGHVTIDVSMSVFCI